MAGLVMPSSNQITRFEVVTPPSSCGPLPLTLLLWQSLYLFGCLGGYLETLWYTPIRLLRLRRLQFRNLELQSAEQHCSSFSGRKSSRFQSWKHKFERVRLCHFCNAPTLLWSCRWLALIGSPRDVSRRSWTRRYLILIPSCNLLCYTSVSRFVWVDNGYRLAINCVVTKITGS